MADDVQTQVDLTQTRHDTSGMPRDDELLPTLVIMCHPNPERVGEQAILLDLWRDGEAYVSRNAPEFSRYGGLGQALMDTYISRSPVIFQRDGHKGVRIRTHHTNTRVTIAERTPQEDYAVSEEELQEGCAITLNDRIVLLLKLLPPQDPPATPDYELKGISSDLLSVRTRIERIAGLDEPVLIRGETGTGKELVAQAIYSNSQRVNKPFVSVNLAAMQDSLAAAELFGAQKGAFTGANSDREGYFSAADGGTLFLDEIGEASADVQAMLLRAIETGEIYPVGSTQPKNINVRLLAATDADLESLSETDGFKLPLLHRLSSYQIFLPTLRDRKEDIGILFQHFAKQQWRRIHPNDHDQRPLPVTPTALMNQLLQFPWPGNVRQLRNVARQVVIDSREAEFLQMDPQLLSMLRPQTRDGQKLSTRSASSSKRRPNSISREELVAALENNRFELQATAEQLAISRASVYQLIQRNKGLQTAQDIDKAVLAECYESCDGDTEQMMWELRVSQIGLRRRLKSLGYDV